MTALWLCFLRLNVCWRTSLLQCYVSGLLDLLTLRLVRDEDTAILFRRVVIQAATHPGLESPCNNCDDHFVIRRGGRNRPSPAIYILCILAAHSRPSPQRILKSRPLRSPSAMVNLFTTLWGILKRIASQIMPLALFLSFVVWLHTRDLFYSVSNASSLHTGLRQV